MPNLKHYKLSDICKIFDEAIRNIPGYDKYDSNREIKANIHYDNTIDNIALIINDCMLTKGKKKKSSRIDKYYEAMLDKKPRKNAVGSSLVLTLPRDFLTKKNYGITEEEYVALEKYYETEDGKNDTEHKYTDYDRVLATNARQKLMKIEFTEQEKIKIKQFFEASVSALLKIFGIKKSDVLYAILHMDESFQHMHMAFLPMEYGNDINEMLKCKDEDIKDKLEKKIEEYKKQGVDVQIYNEKSNGRVKEVFYGLRKYEPNDSEKPFGCGIKRFKKGQLHSLNSDLEMELKKRGIEAHISTKRGNQFNVSSKNKQERRDGIADEVSLQEIKKIKEQSKKKILELNDTIEEKETIIQEMEKKYNATKIKLSEMEEKYDNIDSKLKEIEDKNRELISINIRLKQKYKKLVENIKKVVQPVLDLLNKINWLFVNQRDKKILSQQMEKSKSELELIICELDVDKQINSKIDEIELENIF